MIAVECFIIRSFLDQITDDREAVKVKHSKETEDAAHALMTLYLESQGSPDPEEHLQKKHRLSLALIQAGQNSEAKIGCPTEQALMACSVVLSGGWRKATFVKTIANSGLWSDRITFSHWGRLSVLGVTSYESPLVSSTLSEDTSLIDPPTLDGLSDDLPQLFSRAGEDEISDDEGESDDEDNDQDENDGDSGETQPSTSFPTELSSQFNPKDIDQWTIKGFLNRMAGKLDAPSTGSQLAQDVPENACARAPTGIKLEEYVYSHTTTYPLLTCC